MDVEAQIREIKARMPKTYAAIQAKAAEIGREAYAYVRRGLAGQPNLFYAVEAGRVVGTPFDLPDISADIAKQMVQFRVGFLIIWAVPQEKGVHGGA